MLVIIVKEEVHLPFHQADPIKPASFNNWEVWSLHAWYQQALSVLALDPSGQSTTFSQVSSTPEAYTRATRQRKFNNSAAYYHQGSHHCYIYFYNIIILSFDRVNNNLSTA